MAMVGTLLWLVGFTMKFRSHVGLRSLKTLATLLHSVQGMQDENTDSKSNWTLNTKSDSLGLTLTEVLREIWLSPMALQSDFARRYDQQIAALASLGFITSQENGYVFGRLWRVTLAGMEHLNEE